MNNIPLTKLQKEIMEEFYSYDSKKVIYDKAKRSELWKKVVKRSNDINFDKIKKECPALYHQIMKSYESGKNVQSAVFSECVYSQTFANIFKLDLFINCYENIDFIPDKVNKLLASYNLVPRYVYSTIDKKRMLIQAGSCGGIDSALITILNLNIFTIEFKEPGAKTSEPDLPKYGEDGILRITKEFICKYPQFEDMLNEQKGLNFFEKSGSNINNFSKESVNIAISNNYVKKYADVICTEDEDGFLVMFPVNQISKWANIVGEIRPAGRNHYSVWTPNALKQILLKKGAIIDRNNVCINISELSLRLERGGNDKVSGYKITSLFFVYINDCVRKGDNIYFNFKHVRQLNPTIAGKMFFNNIHYFDIKKYYEF